MDTIPFGWNGREYWLDLRSVEWTVKTVVAAAAARRSGARRIVVCVPAEEALTDRESDNVLGLRQMLGAKCRVLGLKLRVEVRRKPLPSTLATSAPDVPRVGPPVPAVQRTYNILVEGAGETESAKLRREATAALEAGGRVLRFWIPPCPPAEAAARRSCVVEASLWLIDTRKEFTLEWRVGRPPSPPANKHQLPSKRGAFCCLRFFKRPRIARQRTGF